MTPINLEEFAQNLRLQGNEFADEILENMDFVKNSIEEGLKAEIEYMSGSIYIDDPLKALDWIEKELEKLDEIREWFENNDMDLDSKLKEGLGQYVIYKDFDL